MKKRMAFGMAAALAFGSCAAGAPVYADEGSAATTEEAQATAEVTAEAGVTPDAFLYGVDRLAERILLAMTFDSQAEAELLLRLAAERLAEARVMAQEQKDAYVNAAVEAYGELLEAAQEQVTETIAEDEAAEEVKDALAAQLEAVAQVDEEIEERLDAPVREALVERRDEAYRLARVVRDLDREKVLALREEGLGYGQIAKVLTLAELSGTPEAEIVALLKDGKGFGEVAKVLGVHPGSGKQKQKEKARRPAEPVNGRDEDGDQAVQAPTAARQEASFETQPVTDVHRMTARSAGKANVEDGEKPQRERRAEGRVQPDPVLDGRAEVKGEGKKTVVHRESREDRDTKQAERAKSKGEEKRLSGRVTEEE